MDRAAHTPIPTQNSPQHIKWLGCVNLLSHWCNFLLSLETLASAYIGQCDKWRCALQRVRVMFVQGVFLIIARLGNVNNMVRRIHICIAYTAMANTIYAFRWENVGCALAQNYIFSHIYIYIYKMPWMTCRCVRHSKQERKV